jgi:nucleoside-diphosphate-sugar epimerase
MTDATSRWRGRRVLVTGCTGLLGGGVVRELLAAGAEVVGLVRDRAAGPAHRPKERFRPVHGRVEDAFRLYSALAVHEVTAVFHLAGPADPSEPDRRTPTVLEAVRLYDPRVPVVTARPAAEPPPANPTPHVPLGIVRFGELFGGGDRKTSRVVPGTVASLITGDRTPAAGTGAPRDFVYAADAARACLLLADAVAADPHPHLCDLTFRSGWRFDDREMAAAVRAVFDGRAEQCPAGERTENPLGWRPAATLAEALAETVAWYREFLLARFLGTRAA